MQLSETREAVGLGLLDFAWRQWAQIGVSAGAGGDDGWAVDPEALVLFTIGVGRGDPRLFDEMLDWIALNHRLLSLQRLRNLTPRFPVDAGLVAAVTASAKESLRMLSRSTRLRAACVPGRTGKPDGARSSNPGFLVSSRDPILLESLGIGSRQPTEAASESDGSAND
jgi:hypothetical protein